MSRSSGGAREFRAEHRAAKARWMAGERDVVFPEWGARSDVGFPWRRSSRGTGTPNGSPGRRPRASTPGPWRYAAVGRDGNARAFVLGHAVVNLVGTMMLGAGESDWAAVVLWTNVSLMLLLAGLLALGGWIPSSRTGRQLAA